jgi:hypothetical protein
LQRFVLRTLHRELSLGLGAMILDGLLAGVLLRIEPGRQTNGEDA